MHVAGLVFICALISNVSAFVSFDSRQLASGPPAGRSAAVSGVVSDAETHRPIEAAVVQLGQRGQGPQYQVTDDRGRFVFTGLRSGSYYLTVTKAGFADAQFGAGPMATVGADIVLSDGQWFKNADVEMPELGVVAGTVTDDRGEPVAGTYVRLFARITLAGESHLAAGPVARTNDRGEYRLEDVVPGRYYVTVPLPQHSVPYNATPYEIEGRTRDELSRLDKVAAGRGAAPQRLNQGLIGDGTAALVLGNYAAPPGRVRGQAFVYPTVFYPGSLDIAGAASVEIEHGSEVLGVDLSLQAMPAHRVSGKLVGCAGACAGYPLRLLRQGLEELGNGSEAATTVADASGNFTFLNVPAGSYTLLAPGALFEYSVHSFSASERLPATPGVGVVGMGASGGRVSGALGIRRTTFLPRTIVDEHAGYASVPVSVEERDVSELEVPLRPTGVLRLQCILEDLQDDVLRGSIEVAAAGGSPLLGSRSVVLPEAATGARIEPVVFPVLLPGEYVLKLSSNANVAVKSVTTGGADYAQRSLTVVPGMDVTAVVTLTGKMARLTGTVLNTKGGVARMVSVLAFPVDTRLWTSYGLLSASVQTTLARTDGTYEFGKLRAGDYYLVGVDFDKANTWTDPAFLQLAVRSAMKVTLGWGDRKALDVRMIGDR
jgi:hypothetical protein